MINLNPTNLAFDFWLKPLATKSTNRGKTLNISHAIVRPGVTNYLANKYKVANGDVLKILKGEDYTNTFKGIAKAHKLAAEFKMLQKEYEDAIEDIKKRRYNLFNPVKDDTRDECARLVSKRLKVERSYVKAVVTGRYTPRNLDSILKAQRIVELYWELKNKKSSSAL